MYFYPWYVSILKIIETSCLEFYLFIILYMMRLEGVIFSKKYEITFQKSFYIVLFIVQIQNIFLSWKLSRYHDSNPFFFLIFFL